MIIKPYKLNDVREAMAGVGIEGTTVSEVKKKGARQKGYSELCRGVEYRVDFFYLSSNWRLPLKVRILNYLLNR